MADKTINQLTEDTSPTSDDYVAVWDAATGSSKKVTIANLRTIILTLAYKFLVYRNAAANTGTGAFAKITFDTEVYDTNSNFATGTYTAPVTGDYRFGFQATTNAATSDLVAAIYKNGAIYAWGSEVRAQGGSGGSIEMSLSAGDTIDVYVYGNTAIALGVGTAPMKTYFYGRVVGY